jgi:hypothetical protein
MGHVVSPDQNSPFRFADAPDFRADSKRTRNHGNSAEYLAHKSAPTMPKLVLYAQEATDVIAYILSLRERR